MTNEKIFKTEEYISRIKEHNLGKSPLIYIHTFGCQQNEADSEKILGMAERMGYRETDNPEKSDLIILNTCAVRHLAEDKALSMLGGFKALKRAKPELVIGVVGCMAAEKNIVKRLKQDFRYVDFTMEPSRLHELSELIYYALTERKRDFRLGTEDFSVVEGMPISAKTPYRGMVSVMYGCNNFCSYCIVPYTRGRERSRLSADILSECREFIKNGAKEIYLLGQNVNSYKSDISFAELISRVAELDGDFIVRFMTSHPKDASVELIETIAEHSPKIAPFFHLPVQSGSSEILSRMNRHYTREKYLETVSLIKEKIPGVALSTDIIVGFPGESEEDFLETLSMLSLVEYDLVYAFIYSKRDGTAAAEYEDKLSRKEKSERLSRLLKLQDEIYIKKNREYIGKSVRVLADSEEIRYGKRILSGKTGTMKTVHFESEGTRLGEFTNIIINKAFVTHLEGEEKGDKND